MQANSSRRGKDKQKLELKKTRRVVPRYGWVQQKILKMFQKVLTRLTSSTSHAKRYFEGHSFAQSEQHVVYALILIQTNMLVKLSY